eukprot:TRINITY_DN2194_c0_g1_i1.p1 TRINITY_DN2194_c0_g1~~TRINITY_DN2194_c0_g1_i1.p1  ORF type:complete len:373 (+),score=71.56 TRINITY_DN2194_c0_g1_i1:143-1261(+)
MTSFLSKFKNGYEDLWKAIIRPPKDEYNIEDLGPKLFSLNGKKYKRTDFQFKNKRGLTIECSHFEPVKRVCEELPCVVYLHGNCSSRVEALPAVEVLLPQNITVCCFDFAGCGKSEGEYISLGWYERDDVENLIDYLRGNRKVTAVGLWGRSMGAVTALLHADRDPTIAGMVLDSPFSNLRVLAEELAKKFVSMPGFVLSAALGIIRKTVQQKANFNLDEVSPKDHVGMCFVPSLFCHGKEDTFIEVHHTKDLHDAYAGDKNIVLVDGDHNSPRPGFFNDSVGIFFYNTLQCKFLPTEDGKDDGDVAGVKNFHYSSHIPRIGNEDLVGKALEDLEEEELRKAIEASLKLEGDDTKDKKDNEEAKVDHQMYRC